MSFVKTSFSGLSFTGRGTFLSGTSTSKAGELGIEPECFDFFATLAA
jgi:hypothetical protein